MPNENEGTVAPDSLEAQALAELQKEGYEIGSDQPTDEFGNPIMDNATPNTPNETKPEAKVEEPKQEDQPKADDPQDPQPNPEGETKKVDAWKLKVAEDQKNSALAQVKELQEKIDELTKQKDPVTKAQQEEISDEIKALAEESGYDPEVLNKLANISVNKAFKKSEELEKTVKELAEERELSRQENLYSQEFDKDILPLVKEKYQLPEAELSQVKSKLKDLAFTEMYANVPLAKIFKAEEDNLGLQVPKKSSESPSAKVTRAKDVVDLENMDEETFNKLSPEQVEMFEAKKTGQWIDPKRK